MYPNPVVSFREGRSGPAFYDRRGIFMVEAGASPAPSSEDALTTEKTADLV